MKQFFKFFLASLLAIIFFIFIGFIIIIGAAATSGNETKVLDKSVIHLDASEVFSEQSQENPLAVLQGGSSHTNGLNKIIRAIDHAKEDKKIKGIYIKMGVCPNGWASLNELREALLDFKKSKKFIYAYGEVADHKSYYLATVADKIFLNPHGGMEFKGLALVGNFMKGSLDKLGVKVEAFHCGQFKGAHEPFSRKDFSEPNEYQLKTMLASIDSVFMRAVAVRTGKSIEELRSIANNLDLKFPQDAVDMKFIDGIVYADSVRSLLKEKSGIDADKEVRFVGIGDYAGNVENMGNGDDKVAIIYATGSIADGEGEDGIYSVNLTQEIRKVAEDEDIKAVVLRVNSPGGSALASEVIYRELELLHAKKPIVVSMGDVAASGGYYIACAGDKIYADANTITGSIGVVGMMFNIGDFMNSKLGVTFDAVKTGQYADFPNNYRDMTATEKQFIQSYLDSVYVTFKSRVAKARGLTLDQVEELAQGHVYSGTLAKELKLVDNIGGKNAALAAVAKLAKLDKYKIVEYPGKTDSFKDLLTMVTGGNRDVALVKEYLGEDYKLLEQIQQLRQQKNGIQALMPFNFDIK
jgi:protease IV